MSGEGGDLTAEEREARLAKIENLAMEHMNCSGCPTPWWLKQALGAALSSAPTYEAPMDRVEPMVAEAELLAAKAEALRAALHLPPSPESGDTVQVVASMWLVKSLLERTNLELFPIPIGVDELPTFGVRTTFTDADRLTGEGGDDRG